MDDTIGSFNSALENLKEADRHMDSALRKTESIMELLGSISRTQREMMEMLDRKKKR